MNASFFYETTGASEISLESHLSGVNDKMLVQSTVLDNRSYYSTYSIPIHGQHLSSPFCFGRREETYFAAQLLQHLVKSKRIQSFSAFSQSDIEISTTAFGP